jgi:hypothetical protein
MSSAFAALVAHGAFWALLAIGWFSDELGARGTAVFLVLWLSGFFGLPFLPYGAALFAPFVAVLDIALVFAIFKGDVGPR